MPEKILIFDSSSIINFSMNGLTNLFEKLREEFNGKFIITEEVKHEVIDIPLKIKKFELAALKTRKLLDKKVFEMPDSIRISAEEIHEETNRVLNLANRAFIARGSFMHIIDKGEASCLALSLLCREKGIKNAIVVDERTTRMLGEMPESLEKLFEKKLHTKVEMREKFKFLKDIIFIRSSELIYIAWRKKLVEDLGNGQALDALLYATKYKGSAISYEEIEEIKRIGKNE